MSKRRDLPRIPGDLIEKVRALQRKFTERLYADQGPIGRALRAGHKSLTAAYGPKQRQRPKEAEVLKILADEPNLRTDLIAKKARCSVQYVRSVRKTLLANTKKGK